MTGYCEELLHKSYSKNFPLLDQQEPRASAGTAITPNSRGN
jgi:hypothetical protein